MVLLQLKVVLVECSFIVKGCVGGVFFYSYRLCWWSVLLQLKVVLVECSFTVKGCVGGVFFYS